MHAECTKFISKYNIKFGNLTMEDGNTTHNGEITYYLNRDLKTAFVSLKT